jgi:DNA-binding MarR family transcriptional regulator
VDLADAAAGRAMDALRRLVSALRTSGGAASGELGMSVAQLFALRVIGASPGLGMGDLAARTLTTASAASEVATRLVDRGLVRRDHDARDRRRVVVHLTGAGASVLASTEETLPERLIASLSAMRPDVRVALAEALETWVAGAGLSAVAPSMFGEGATPAAGVRAVEPAPGS